MDWYIILIIYGLVATLVGVAAFTEAGHYRDKVKELGRDAGDVLAVLEREKWEIVREMTAESFDRPSIFKGWRVGPVRDVHLARAWKLACVKRDAQEAADKMVAEEMAR